MAKLILMRHGQSVWNKKNLFTGWVDVPLSQQGIDEALDAGKEISEIPIDVIFVSTLMRAQLTAFLAMSQHATDKVCVLSHSYDKKKEKWGKSQGNPDQEIPVFSAWQLNERMYGDLQGLDKDETRAKYGKEQVKVWRRSYDIPPPNGESLEMTAKRTIPYFQSEIVKYLKEGKNVLISAHGNSLRSIVMVLDGLSKQEVLELEIPTGKPLFYEFNEGNWKKSK